MRLAIMDWDISGGHKEWWVYSVYAVCSYIVMEGVGPHAMKYQEIVPPIAMLSGLYMLQHGEILHNEGA